MTGSPARSPGGEGGASAKSRPVSSTYQRRSSTRQTRIGCRSWMSTVTVPGRPTLTSAAATAGISVRTSASGSVRISKRFVPLASPRRSRIAASPVIVAPVIRRSLNPNAEVAARP